MRQEPPKIGNLASRHDQCSTKAFLKMADNQWKEAIKYFRTGYSFVQRAIQEGFDPFVPGGMGNTYHSSAKVFMQLPPSIKPSATRNSIIIKFTINTIENLKHCNRGTLPYRTYPVVQIQPN